MFQKRHFEVIAATIKAMPVDLNTRCIIARDFFNELSKTNPKMDWRRFMAACGAIPAL